MYKLTGILKVINPTAQVNEKFCKREFVVTDASSMYPQDIQFQLMQDKCSILDAFFHNEQVEVSFNLNGREWTSPSGEVKYFNTLNAWRIERVGVAPQQSSAPQAQNTATPPTQTDEENGDLPF